MASAPSDAAMRTTSPKTSARLTRRLREPSHTRAMRGAMAEAATAAPASAPVSPSSATIRRACRRWLPQCQQNPGEQERADGEIGDLGRERARVAVPPGRQQEQVAAQEEQADPDADGHHPQRSAGCVRTRSTSTATARTQTMLLNSAVPSQLGKKAAESPRAARPAPSARRRAPREATLTHSARHPVSSAVRKDLY